MPRPIFDVEQYELRGILPEVYTDAQKKALNETLARVNGQIDWTAQLLGFSGPNYWGRPNPKSDGTYNWTGLVETMNEKRQMQVGTYGVFNKHLDYKEWPSPLNREHIGASGDCSFHLYEEDDHTKISPLHQLEGVDYMHEPAVFAGGSYIFDADLEIVGKEIDIDQYLTVHRFIEHERTWTRLAIKSEAVGGTLQVRRAGSEAEYCPLELLHWFDISDWKSESTQDQYIGLWGNKGAAASFDFSFDALDLHGLDERYSLVLTTGKYTLTPEELFEKVGLTPSFWTGVDGDKFSFRISDCEIPFPALPPYINGPYNGWPWEPQYIDDGLVFLECTDNCNYDVIGRQYLTEVNDFDNGEFENFCSNTGLPGFTDCVDQIIPIDQFLNNGTLEDEIPTSGTEDEGEYDRIPWRTISHFEFELIPKTDCAGFSAPCLEWVFDPSLDNGTMEQVNMFAYDSISNELPGEPSGNLIVDYEPGGPSATVSEGEYDKTFAEEFNEGSSIQGCVDDQWQGYDDGEYDEVIEPDCDKVDEVTLYYDGGWYTTPLVLPDYNACNCETLACWADNLEYFGNIYGPEPDVYQGPEKADMGEYGADLLPSITFVDGEEDVYAFPEEGCDCTVVACEVDSFEYGGTLGGQSPDCATVDGKEYDLQFGRPDPQPIPPEECAEKCPEAMACHPGFFYVNLEDAFSSMTHSLRPDLRNSYTTLRVWKDRILTNINEVPNSELHDHNFLVADQNAGATPEDSYRHFVRLPLEYPRDGKEWNRAVAVCDNMSYFSTPQKLSGTLDPPRDLSPRLYSETYQDLDDYEVLYEEDFLTSSITSDTTEVAPGFEDSGIFRGEDESLPFAHAVITEFNPIEQRIPDSSGEWRGSYYVPGTSGVRTGHVSRDLEDHSLIELDYEEYPKNDFSMIKMPDIQFPSDSGIAPMRNYMVSYAYFAADFSASDDPVFDPNKSQCWRQSVLDCLEKPYDGGPCTDQDFETQTQYILHPTT